MNFVKKHKIAFVAIPKVACSSIKHLFFELENDTSFTLFRANGRAYNVHNFYPSRYFRRDYDPEDFADCFRFVVLRDPVQRFLSCYSNRVLTHRNLARWALPDGANEAGATPDPDLSGFVARLDLYRKWSKHIRHHTDRAVDFTGPDLSWFDAVYPIERMDDCAARLSEICARPIVMPHRQAGDRKFTIADLSPAELDKIVAFYRADYDLMADYYSPPEHPG